MIRTNRQLHAVLSALEVPRDLESYLLALLALGREFAARDPGREPTPDEIAALFTAAVVAPAPPLDAAARALPPWYEEPRPHGSARFVAILADQIVDLEAMRVAGQLDDPHRGFGITSPRGGRWSNLDATVYVECAAAGSVGESTEIVLVTPPEPVAAGDRKRRSFGWNGVCDLLIKGQIYE